MRLTLWFLSLVGLAFSAVGSFAADALVRKTWTVGGITREALVALPAKATKEPAPLVFVFHGHGGSMENSARSFSLHTLWPEAVVVYPQGLLTPGQLTDPEGKKSGWQSGPGHMGDRDLHFFDAMLAGLRAERPIDDKRIYSTGHSNGGGFTYLLLAQRGNVFAAVAPSAAVARSDKQGPLAPRPVLHLAGRKDTLVKFAWQDMMIKQLLRTRECGAGQAQPDGVMFYPSPSGATVSTYIHDGTHQFPSTAPALIVTFFKANRQP